jgi:hypothetical protein
MTIKAVGTAQVVEHSHAKYKALGSIPSTAKQTNDKKRNNNSKKKKKKTKGKS